MLRAEQQGAFNGVGMGQRSSKVESIDTASSIDRMASNGQVNGTDARPQQASASPRLTSSFIRSSEEGFSIRGTSKQTRDERDERDKDEYEANGNYRVHLSHSNTQSVPDRYSPQGQNGSVSPTDIRHTFVPERSDHWSPSKRHQDRRENSGSSNAAHRQGRTDQWIPGLSSSPRSPSPPPRPRPPLGPRANSALTKSQSRIGPKPFMRERRGSEAAERARYTNLKWTASGSKSKQATTDSAQRTSAAVIESPLSPVDAPEDHGEEPAASEKVNVNGIKGVPTGPKSDPRVIIAVLEANKRRPYISIPGSFLPPQPATVPHLYKFLAKYINTMSDIEFDDSGYYLYFDRTEAGLDRLDHCYWAKNRHMMFSQYVLEMVRHHDGLDHSIFNTDMNTHGHQGTTNVPSTNQLSGIPKQTGGAAVSHVESSLSTPPFGNPNAIPIHPRLELTRATEVSPILIETPVNGVPATFRHSSPLRVPSRLDKDDSSSSISGFTGSDLSASRASKCHRCEGPSVSDSDSLIRCSSCPRRYHRRCHKSSIPQDLEPEHTWQCDRCVRKKVPPKSRLSNAPSASTSPAPSVGQPEEPPAKRPRLTYTTPDLNSTNVSAVAAATISNGVPQQKPNLYPNEITTDPVSLNPPDIPGLEKIMDPAPQVNTDELRISEVDDLVERSFTSTVETKKPEEKTKLFLSLKRKKIARAENNSGTEIDSRNENNSAPSVGRTDASHSQAQDTEVDGNTDTPKRERHKWKGGGADKDIIQAGMQDFFSERSVHKDRTASTKSRQQGELRAFSSPGTRAEVPESPEDSRTVDNINGRTNEKEDQHVAAQPSPKVRLKINGPKPSEGQTMRASKPQTGPAQRMKPSGISADKCKMCGKTIAFNPAGNKICSKCKREAASAEPTTSSAGEPPSKEKIAEQDVPPAAFIAAEIGDNVDALLNSTGPEEDDRDAESSRSKSPHTVDDEEPSLEPSRSKRPCNSCRSRHKRCTHRTDEGVTERGHEDIAEEDTARDDLDFWHAALDQNNTGNLEDSTFEDGETPINNPPSTTGANRDRSSSLSPAPDDAPTFSTKTKKRVSHARTATSEYDLGDSKERPPNTYKKLIGMALCAAPDYCLKASEIIHWIAKNIPDYALGEGTRWESGISATLSMNREKDGNTGLWRKIGGEGTRKNDPCWYQLQRGQEYEMLHWDPVLKQPVSPMKRRDEKGSSNKSDRRMEGSSPHDVLLKESPAETSASPTQVPKRRLKLKAGKTPSIARKHAPKSIGDAGKASNFRHQDMAISNIDIDELQLPDPVESKEAQSSDDEPIAMSRNKRSTLSKHAIPAAVPDRGMYDDSRDREVLNGVTETSESNATRTPAGFSIMRQFKLPSASVAVDKKIVAELIKEDAENVDCSAQSLFNEWPEFNPANEFDRAAKIDEIRRRPTRKQKFNGKSHDPWSEPAQLNHNDVNNYTSPRPNRSTRNFEMDVFAWQANDDVKHFDSLEEMFDLPIPRSSIIQDGQIAYRDGTRSEFRRAKRIYNTGYAKHH